MTTVNINNQSYEVDEEVAEQFSKFIRKANESKERILQLEDLANTVAHVSVDFGYGEFQLEAQHIEQARKLVPQK